MDYPCDGCSGTYCSNCNKFSEWFIPAWEDSCNRIALACGFDRKRRKLDADAMEARAEKVSYGQLMARRGKT